jgi:hypothetical protein
LLILSVVSLFVSFSSFFLSFFVYVFLIDGHLSAVEQVVVIVVILLAIEAIIGWFMRDFCYSRGIGPIEQHVRLAAVSIPLYGLFIGLTAWQWTLLPENSAVLVLIRFFASSIAVIVGEIFIWGFLYSCATECCPCIKVDDGRQSLEDIQAEKEEQERKEREEKRKKQVVAKREKMKKKLKRSVTDEMEV